MQKFTRYLGTFIFLWGVTAMMGFFIARTGGHLALGHAFQRALVAWIWVVVAAGGYMAAVGVYHTALAVLGLDGEPGLFSRGARTGPLSGETEPVPVPGTRPPRAGGR